MLQCTALSCFHIVLTAQIRAGGGGGVEAAGVTQVRPVNRPRLTWTAMSLREVTPGVIPVTYERLQTWRITLRLHTLALISLD